MNKKIILFLFSILLFLFLLLASYKSVLFFADLTPVQQTVFHFLAEKENLQSGFTELEASHLEDVKKVMIFADYVFYILSLALISIITYYKKDRGFVLRLFNYGGKFTVVAIAILGIISLLFFDLIFSLFHQLFFPQGNWTFAADSLIIQTFPLEFFVAISRNIFLLTLFLGMIFILSPYTYHYVRSNRN